jgi:multiple antibiotic resistance protein
MTLHLAFAVKVFSALFAIMNPIANIPIFLSLTDGFSASERRRVARVTLIGVTIGCVVSAAVGSAILGFFGLTVNDFRLAGGLLVLLIALSMLHGSPSAQHQPSDKEVGEKNQDVAIYPLTVPLLVGPGTIATLTVFGHTAMADGEIASLVLGIAAFLVLLAASLFAASFMARYLSPPVTAIAQRLMGMILAAIAVQMIVASLQVSFKAIAG